MAIYERFGVKPIINVAGPATRYGGALMEKSTLEAMDGAAKLPVRLDELQATASKVIAKVTHAEAGIVTCGAAAALTLGTAACIAGLDIAKMNQLPDTSGMRNEVIIPWNQVSGYVHCIRAAGARLIGVGIPNFVVPPYEVHIISKQNIESGITANTAAITYRPQPGSHPPLEEVIEIGKKHNIPVILDAAGLLPPRENLHKFIDMGADLVCFSGGKGMRGPQASGILCGRWDLIASAALQTLDMAGEPFEEWNPPASLIPKDKLSDKPAQGIGRGMKAAKEAIIGLLVALENFTEEKIARDAEYRKQLLRKIQAKLENIPGLKITLHEKASPYPLLEIKIDKKIAGKSALEIAQKLLKGDPSIYVRNDYRYLHNDLIALDSTDMNEEIVSVVSQRLYDIFTG